MAGKKLESSSFSIDSISSILFTVKDMLQNELGKRRFYFSTSDEDILRFFQIAKDWIREL